MYRSCIFCSALLGANDSIEQFPVGRSIAFDAAKGRLWAVCPRCARWNLAPIEERWEAVEEAERLFHHAPTRVHSENIGLAKLRDGTRLVRVGKAGFRELVAWRYAETFASRWRRANRFTLTGMALGMVAAAPIAAGLILPAIALCGAAAAAFVKSGALAEDFPTGAFGSRIVYLARARDGAPVPVRAGQLALARVKWDAAGCGVALKVPSSVRTGPAAERSRDNLRTLVLRGDDAVTALARGLVLVNRRGGTAQEVSRAEQAIARAGSPRRLLVKVGRRGPLITGAMVPPGTRYATTADRSPDVPAMLAVEMALQHEIERRALEGELAALEEMWRQAEEIASIADRLPDDLPPLRPPRLR